jgi:threonine dehydrogenase-like Zn-dependent dehydrogenase
MLAAVFSCATGKVTVEERWSVPVPAADEALIKVLRAGVCATVSTSWQHLLQGGPGPTHNHRTAFSDHSVFLQDLEITRGYVPGYHQPLGHEFVGVVEACSSRPQLVGKRVVGEINCNDAHYSCADAVFQRNHAPGRSV